MSLTLTLRRLRLDGRRSVHATFVPGRALRLGVSDRAGVRYSLYLPPDALKTSRSIHMTAYSSAVVPGRASGTGVELAPSGLRFRAPALLTLKGAAKGSLLLTFDRTHGLFVPRPAHVVGRDHSTFVLEHFSSDSASSVGFGDIMALAELSLSGPFDAAAAGADRVVAALDWLGEEARVRDVTIEKLISELPSPAREYMLDALEAHTAELRAAAKAASRAACASGPDEASLNRARDAIDAAYKPIQAISAARADALEVAATKRCFDAFIDAGDRYCEAARASQDGPGRARAREDYLQLARRLGNYLGPHETSSALAAIRACTGYRVVATGPAAGGNATLQVKAHTCADVIAGPWTGKYGYGGPQGQPPSEEGATAFTVPTTSAPFEWAPTTTDDTGTTYTSRGVAHVPDTLDFYVYASNGPDSGTFAQAHGAIESGADPGTCGTD
jgi:hypothetical protein